jgi:peptidoglycan/LPS O-acetylase OafA/YrhL
MFGTYRFILASLVALSHFGVQHAGFNPGQWAVVSFYTLSGLLMERQCGKLGNGGFYLDRLLRIYPLYLAVLLLAACENHPSWIETAANISLLPLNYSFFTGITILIGPAWSLACEAHFYLLVPLLVLCSTKMLRVILLSSLSLFAMSPFLPCSTFLAYTGLPGILFTFASGMLINRRDFFFLKIIWSAMLVLLAAFAGGKLFHSGLPTGIHINVCLGYLAAIVIISRLDRFPRGAGWDNVLGMFSYPLFLCHGVVAAFVQNHFSVSNPLLLLAASVCFSAILILTVEIPFDRVRYGLRKNFKSPSQKSTASASA